MYTPIYNVYTGVHQQAHSQKLLLGFFCTKYGPFQQNCGLFSGYLNKIVDLFKQNCGPFI